MPKPVPRVPLPSETGKVELCETAEEAVRRGRERLRLELIEIDKRIPKTFGDEEWINI